MRREFLEAVDIPTLVICGDRDLFTPKTQALGMAKKIPGGELLVVRGASHYAALEYPELGEPADRKVLSRARPVMNHALLRRGDVALDPRQVFAGPCELEGLTPTTAPYALGPNPGAVLFPG